MIDYSDAHSHSYFNNIFMFVFISVSYSYVMKSHIVLEDISSSEFLKGLNTPDHTTVFPKFSLHVDVEKSNCNYHLCE